MGEAGKRSAREDSEDVARLGESLPSGTRPRAAIVTTVTTGSESPGVAPLSKLVSRIPPAPRLPSFDGLNVVTSSDLAETPASRPEPEAAGAVSAPRYVVKQRARSRDRARAWGAVIAALLLGAAIVWATTQ